MLKLKKPFDDLLLFALVLVLGALQFGGTIWPQLGIYWNIINASIVAGIIVLAFIMKLYRYPLVVFTVVFILLCVAGIASSQRLDIVNNSTVKSSKYSQQEADNGNASTARKPIVASNKTENISTQSAGNESTDYCFGIKTKCTDFWLAIFTGCLVLVGTAQSVIFYRQWNEFKTQATFLKATVEEMKAATAVSDRVAKATELSANAALNVELPFLHIEEIRITPKYVATDNSSILSNFYPRITVRNYGRTPATVTEVIINYAIAKALPLEPQYEILIPYPDTTVIDGKGTETYKDYAYYGGGRSFTDEEIASVANKTAWLYIYGKIIYKNFLGIECTKGFICSWVCETNHFFVPNIYSKYDYQT